MDRAELEARPNGLHSRQKISHHTSLFEHNTMALLLFFAQKMSNACGKSAKYSLSSGGFNYLLTREGFVKKRKKERKMFVRILKERKDRSLFPDRWKDVSPIITLLAECYFSQSFSIWDVTDFPGRKPITVFSRLDYFFLLLCGFRFD